MTVRNPDYRPRRPPDARVPPRRPHARRRTRVPFLAAGVILLLGVPLVLLGLLGGRPDPSRPDTAQGSGAAATRAPEDGSPGSSAPAGGTTEPGTAEPDPSEPSEPGATLVDTPLVPVTHFRSAVTATGFDEARAVLAGTSKRYAALELVEADADGVLAALGASRPADRSRLVLARDAAAVAEDLAENRDRLAFLRAEDVTPAVRAIAWGGASLFGVDRVESAADWPLRASLPARSGGSPAYDPEAAWTLVAGGDILLDRGVYQTVRIDGKGVDFPWDGGTAEITSRYCCSSFGWELPVARRTGNAGAVRDLFERADVAIANFENPAPNDFVFHTSGTIFTADPGLIDGLVNAGIDYVSLANNHIRDAGARGILETIENLEQRGLRFSGAGEDLEAARTPAVLDAGGVQVAILGYDAIAAEYAAEDDRVGNAPLSANACEADVRAARDAGADVVIIFPHWGIEYRATPSHDQQAVGRACLDAGADMVIGNHAHWASAMEVYDGKPIWYALGNLVFDQTWSEPTMEGLILEMTFSGAELRQVRVRPHIILDRAQPNFLDAAGDGRIVMDQVWDASEGLLPW